MRKLAHVLLLLLAGCIAALTPPLPPRQKWTDFNYKLHHLFEHKKEYIAGYLYEYHQVEVELSKIESVVDTGCWCNNIYGVVAQKVGCGF